MPYTPITKASRARFSGGLSWLSIPPYATFVVPFSHGPLGSDIVADPTARAVLNDMTDTTVGVWESGCFTAAREGQHRFIAQFTIYKQRAQGQRLEAFLRLEVVRNGVATVIATHDAVDYVATAGEIVLPLRIEATPILKAGDLVQARFGLIENVAMYIITDHEHTFLDATAYWR